MGSKTENKLVVLMKSMFWPRYRLELLTKQKEEMEKIESKRGFIKRLNAPLTLLGLGIVLGVIFMAIFAPWLTPYTEHDLTTLSLIDMPYRPPSALHPLGTSNIGWDVLGRIIWGARNSLTLGILSILISLVFGILIGLTSAYFGGWFDNIMMRIMDIILALPSLVIALVVIGILGSEVQYILIVFGILEIPLYARILRGSVLSVKQSVYVDAARVSGASNFRIMFRHIIINCLSPIIVTFTFDIGGIILSLAAISFLGFGDPNMVQWGNDLALSQVYMQTAPWSVVYPGIAILITVFGFMLLGDGLRDALDPRLKNL
jgi:peptide/nickel transport system permease protein